MLGDVADITGRLRAVLPGRWFPDVTPNLNALLGCLATPWSWLYGLIQYVIQQSRIGTASGPWLDLVGLDFFGATLERGVGEADDAYRSRIQWALLQGAATRPAVLSAMTHLTGSSPIIFEPARAADTGAYGASGFVQTGLNLAYGRAGGWGSLSLPYQFFATVTRPRIQGVSAIGGYGTSTGGFGVGAIAYVDLAMLVGNVSDSDIAAGLSSVLPLDTIAWLRLV
jgi:hypothetical protein